jgi:hypothetical protein
MDARGGCRNSANHAPATKKWKTRPGAGFSRSGYHSGSSVRFSFLFITFAAVFLFAFAFVITDATLFLTAVLFVIAIILPIVAPIFASIVSHNQIYFVDRI